MNPTKASVPAIFKVTAGCVDRTRLCMEMRPGMTRYVDAMFVLVLRRLTVVRFGVAAEHVNVGLSAHVR